MLAFWKPLLKRIERIRIHKSTDPRTRIRIKMSLIRTTGRSDTKFLLADWCKLCSGWRCLPGSPPLPRRPQSGQNFDYSFLLDPDPDLASKKINNNVLYTLILIWIQRDSRVESGFQTFCWSRSWSRSAYARLPIAGLISDIFLKGIGAWDGFFARCILSKIERKELKFCHVVLIFTWLGQDLTHLVHRENTHSEIFLSKEGRKFYCILFSYGSDICKMLLHMVEILTL